MYKNNLLIISLLLIFIYILTKYSYTKNQINNHVHQPIIPNNLYKHNTNTNLWLYWENIGNKKKPTYIDLCHETIKRNAKIPTIFLSPENIHHYLPTLRNDLHKLSIPQKADYIRICILKEYGGMWLDSDIIVYKSLKPLINKLEKYDYIGFGCHHDYCKDTLNGKHPSPKPANWAMISRKNGILISKCLEQANLLLDSNMNFNMYWNYHKLGRELLWSQMNYLLTNSDWDYYHYTSKNVERDKFGEKYTNERFLSDEIMYPSKSFFTPLYNTAPGFPNWFLKMTKSQLVNKDMLICQLFRKALQL